MLNLQQKKKRAQNLENALSGISSDVEVVLSGSPKNALAFVESNSEQKNYIAVETLDDKGTSRHGLVHEDLHNKVQFWGLPLTESFTQNHSDILAKGAKLSLLEDNTALMEGFNEMATIKKVGVDHQVAYNRQEVPAAQKLETLAQKILGISLLDIYLTGNKFKFANTLKQLADKCLLLENSAKKFTDDKEMMRKVDREIYRNNLEVTNLQNADEIVDKIESEILIREIYKDEEIPLALAA